MWIADNWNDYELLDCSEGEKLERWGSYILVRPDPQVIWNTEKTLKTWHTVNGHYHRSSRGGGEWEFFDLPEQWTINYKSLTFHLKPFSFKHTGLFPEQAANWDWAMEKIRAAGRVAGVSLGSADEETIRDWYDRGVRMISTGFDVSYIMDGARANLAAMRRSAPHWRRSEKKLNSWAEIPPVRQSISRTC